MVQRHAMYDGYLDWNKTFVFVQSHLGFDKDRVEKVEMHKGAGTSLTTKGYTLYCA